jgi:imidazolonepropionase-like amidohydrolase
MDEKTSKQRAIVIKGALTFNGKSSELIKGSDVLIENNKITRIDKNITAPDGAATLEADGRTLIPGLIDAHWHSLLSVIPLAKLLQSDIGYMNLAGAQANRDALLRGFTTVRDIGGNVFALKKATDEGIIDGPRIYPSGAYISQTSGHGDFRGPNETPVNPCSSLHYLSQAGISHIADGVPEVIKRTREVLRSGASQIKAMAGGGVSSLYDPLDVTEYTFEEMKAIVDVAKTWNTYVAVHACSASAKVTFCVSSS